MAAVWRFRICMGDASCCGNKFSAFCEIIGEECADNCAPHGWPIAGGKYTTPVRRETLSRALRMARSVARPIPAGTPRSQRRSFQAKHRWNANRSSGWESKVCATKRVCSVSSLHMPRPKKSRCRQGPCHLRRCGRGTSLPPEARGHLLRLCRAARQRSAGTIEGPGSYREFDNSTSILVLRVASLGIKDGFHHIRIGSRASSQSAGIPLRPTLRATIPPTMAALVSQSPPTRMASERAST